jgi:hypothetical protein
MEKEQQERDELLSQLTLDDILFNYAEALNKIWNNLSKIQLIAYDDWDEFVNDFWRHLVVKTLCWKYGITTETLGLQLEISGTGISSGRTKVIANLKEHICDYWTYLNEKRSIAKTDFQRLELVDITTIGVNLTSWASMIYKDVSPQKDDPSFLFPLEKPEQMNFDYAKIKIIDNLNIKTDAYFKLSDLHFELEDIDMRTTSAFKNKG